MFHEAFQAREGIAQNPVLQPQLEALKRIAESYLQEDIVYCTMDEYMRFFRDGNRMEYEYKYFSRRGRIASFALMLYIYRDMRFLQPLEDTIWAICDEFTWSLPAHLPEKDYDCYRTWIDLFAAETGFALSEIKFLLSEELSERTKHRIRKEVRKRIIRGYLEAKTPFSWESAKHNWAAVCGGSVGAVSMYEGTAEETEQVLARLEHTMQCFLAGFSEDGICMEGYSYWEYGFGFFTAYAELLRQYTGGKRDYFADDRVKRIASFPNIAMIRPGCTVTFSDIGKNGKPAVGMTYFLNNRYHELQIMEPDDYQIYGFNHCYRFQRLARDFIWTQYYSDKITKESSWKDAVYYPYAQWFIKKTEKMIVCAKGGSNGEPHNHNDVGSFYIDNYKKQILCDFGCAEYTRDYFSPEKRYTYLVTSSYGHNLPIIGKNGQRAGKKFRAEVLTANENEFSLELKGVYDEPRLESFIRKLSVFDDSVRINDSFIVKEKIDGITERFVTKEKPLLRGERLIWQDAQLIFHGGECIISEAEYSNHYTCQPEKVFLIDITYADIQGAFDAEIEFIVK